MRCTQSIRPRSELAHSVFVICLLLPLASHPLQGLIGYRINTFFFVVLSILTAFGLCLSHGRCQRIVVGVSLILIFAGAIGSIFSGIMQQLLIGCAGAGMLIAASLIHRVLATRQSIRILIWLDILILVGAWVGFVYALSGHAPILETINPGNKQVLFLYLSTFTNSVLLNVIRPSGMFDEPGALAMFSIIVVCLNELYDGKRLMSITILLLTLITFSLMALLALVTYVMLTCAVPRSLRSWAWVGLVLGGLVAGYFAGGEAVRSLYVKRFVVKKGNIISNNNRTIQVLRFFDMVDSDIVLAGASAFPEKYPKVDQSSNPFSILYASGVFVWVPYVLLVLWLASLIFCRSRALKYAAVVLALLLLQRPYVYSMYWGLWIDVLLVSIYRCRLEFGTRFCPRLCGAGHIAESSDTSPVWSANSCV